MTDDTPMENEDEGRFDFLDWKLSLIAGVLTWVAGVAVTYVTIAVSGVEDAIPGAESSTIDLAVAFFYESIGGAFDTGGSAGAESIGDAAGAITGFGLHTLYAALDSNVWGAWVSLHYLLAALTLIVAGYVLAGRYKAGEVASAPDPTPTQVVAGGASLALGFALATFVGLGLFGDGLPDVHTGQQLILSLVVPLVFAGFGAGVRSRARTVTSIWGLVGGVVAAVTAFGVWYVVEDPLGESSLSDFSGRLEYLAFFESYLVETHALEYGETLPEFWVMLGIVVVGAAVVYHYGTTDWLRALGQGSRLGVGYVLVVFAAGLGTYAEHMSSQLDLEMFERAELIAEANQLFGAQLPSLTIVAGIVWPAAMGAIGGAVGTWIVSARADADEPVSTRSDDPAATPTDEPASPTADDDSPEAPTPEP